MRKEVCTGMFVFGILLAIMVMPGAALAQGTGFYAGLGFGQSEVDQPMGAEVYSNFDDTDTAYKLFFGYAVSKGFAVEFTYAELGSFTLNPDPVVPEASFKQEASALSLAGVGSVPLSDRIALIAKIGLAKWQRDITEFDGVDTFSGSKSGMGMLVGLGFQFDLKPVLLRVEYEQYQDVGDGTDATPISAPGKFDGTDIDVFGLSVAYQF